MRVIAAFRLAEVLSEKGRGKTMGRRGGRRLCRHQNVELLRLGETFKIIEPSHQPSTATTFSKCHTHVFLEHFQEW